MSLSSAHLDGRETNSAGIPLHQIQLIRQMKHSLTLVCLFYRGFGVVCVLKSYRQQCMQAKEGELERTIRKVRIEGQRTVDKLREKIDTVKGTTKRLAEARETVEQHREALTSRVCDLAKSLTFSENVSEQMLPALSRMLEQTESFREESYK